jgi:hypothetical protein
VKSVWRISLAVGLLALQVSAAGAPRPRTVHELSITARLETTSGSHRLRFTVRNVSQRVATFYDRDLPWDPQQNNSFIIVAVKTDPWGSVLASSYEARGSELGKVITLKPGAALGGVIDLDAIFPALSAELDKQDVYILWSHTMELNEPQRFNEVFGGVSIPWNHYGEIIGDPPPPPPPKQ